MLISEMIRAAAADPRQKAESLWQLHGRRSRWLDKVAIKSQDKELRKLLADASNAHRIALEEYARVPAALDLNVKKGPAPRIDAILSRADKLADRAEKATARVFDQLAKAQGAATARRMRQTYNRLS